MRKARSRVVDDAKLTSDVSWSKALDRSVGYKEDIQRCRYSESQARARRHERQTDHLNDTMRNEKVSSRRAKTAARKRRLQRDQSDMTATLLPDGTTNGGLEGRELKSWHLIMKRHAEVIATAKVRVTSKLDKHVEHRRKDLRKKSRVRFENATANDGGMSGNQLEWWRRQRELHDRVIDGASVRVEVEHEKHVTDEWERKRKKRKEKDEEGVDLNDGCLEGPERKHWRIMRSRHDELIDNATNTIETRLGKHVLEYRASLERKKKGPDGVQEAGLSGRELKNWKLFQAVHDKIISTAEKREESKLEPHARRYRAERRAKSHARFKNYDISSGGLEGPELKLWKSIKKTHDQVVGDAEVRVEMELPKHVQIEWDRKKKKLDDKWRDYSPDVNGGFHGVELGHWKIMHAMHDKLVATAKPTFVTRLEKHVEEYRHHLKKKHVTKWSEPDNAGLSGRELKWWREQKEMYNNLINTATSTMLGGGAHGEGDMELPKHVMEYREYLVKERKEKERKRTTNDGMLSGPELVHWKIMTGIHDELISTAKKTIDVELEPHLLHHIEYVKNRSKQKWDPSKGFTAGLDGPELHHWHEMTKLHERVVAAATSQVDCHRVKSVAELVMEKRHEEKWGTKPHTSTVRKKKMTNGSKTKKKTKKKTTRLGETSDVPPLTEAEYERALEIAAVIQREIYQEELVKQKKDLDADGSGGGGNSGAGGGGEGGEMSLPTWSNVRELKETVEDRAVKFAVLDETTSFTRRRLHAALEAASTSSEGVRSKHINMHTSPNSLKVAATWKKLDVFRGIEQDEEYETLEKED